MARAKPDTERKVLVTGGSRGLGLAIAKQLAGAGYGVIAVARRTSKEVTAAIADTGRAGQGTLEFHPFDLGNIEQIPDLVRSLRKEFGPLYALVNNAALGTDGVLATMHNSQTRGTRAREHALADRAHQIRGAGDDGRRRRTHR